MKPLVLLSFLFLIFFSCKNKLEVNAPYKDVPNVYAVLCAQENKQYIRINKTFLGEGDANQMAQVTDSVNYQPNELTVTLKRFVNGAQVNASAQSLVVTFGEEVIQTNPGAFSRWQRIYTTTEKLFTSGDYELIVKNNKSGAEFKAKSPAMDSIRVTKSWTTAQVPPLLNSYKVYPYPNAISNDSSKYLVDLSTINQKYSLYVPINEPGLKGYIYQATIRANYYDSIALANSAGHVKRENFVDYFFSPKLNPKDKVYTPIYGDHLPFELTGGDLAGAFGFEFSKKGSPAAAGEGFIGRFVYKLTFIINSSTQDYYNYLNFSSPSLNVAQEKPLYTNFENKAAYGIFTFKSRCMLARRVSGPYSKFFGNDSRTCNYNFFYFAPATSSTSPGGYTPLTCQ